LGCHIWKVRAYRPIRTNHPPGRRTVSAILPPPRITSPHFPSGNGGNKNHNKNIISQGGSNRSVVRKEVFIISQDSSRIIRGKFSCIDFLQRKTSLSQGRTFSLYSLPEAVVMRPNKSPGCLLQPPSFRNHSRSKIRFERECSARAGAGMTITIHTVSVYSTEYSVYPSPNRSTTGSIDRSCSSAFQSDAEYSLRPACSNSAPESKIRM
jgi:hypothetical protein